MNDRWEAWERRVSALLASGFLAGTTEIGARLGPRRVIVREILDTWSG